VQQVRVAHLHPSIAWRRGAIGGIPGGQARRGRSGFRASTSPPALATSREEWHRSCALGKRHDGHSLLRIPLKRVSLPLMDKGNPEDAELSCWRSSRRPGPPRCTNARVSVDRPFRPRRPMKEWVGEGGLEPPRPFGHRNLNPARSCVTWRPSMRAVTRKTESPTTPYGSTPSVTTTLPGQRRTGEPRCTRSSRRPCGDNGV